MAQPDAMNRLLTRSPERLRWLIAGHGEENESISAFTAKEREWWLCELARLARELICDGDLGRDAAQQQLVQGSNGGRWCGRGKGERERMVCGSHTSF